MKGRRRRLHPRLEGFYGGSVSWVRKTGGELSIWGLRETREETQRRERERGVDVC